MRGRKDLRFRARERVCGRGAYLGECSQVQQQKMPNATGTATTTTKKEMKMMRNGVT